MASFERSPTDEWGWPRNHRGGVLRDAMRATALVVLAAFVLDSFRVTLGEILNRARQFFGH